MVELTLGRSDWRHPDGFYIDRPHGTRHFTFVRFLCEVEIRLEGRVRTAEAGSFIVFSPGTPQHWICRGHELRHDWLHAEGEVGALLDKYGIAANRLYSGIRGHGISEAFKEIGEEFTVSERHSSRLLELKLEELIIRIARAAEVSELSLSRELSQAVAAARSAMLSDITEPPAIEEMARRAAVSTAYFYRIYRRLFGTSPKSELTAARIQVAKVELLNGSSVSSVAAAVGYSSEYQFIRQFKQLTGVTPGKYRSESLCRAETCSKA